MQIRSHSSLRKLVLDRINCEATLSVAAALSRLAHIPHPPGSQYIQLSDNSPSIFTSSSNVESSFDVLLQLPIPDVLHRSAVRNALAKASEEFPDLEPSLEVNYASHLVYLPVWILDLWPSLGTLVSHCRDWALARSTLFQMTESSPEMKELVQQLTNHLTVIPLDTVVPSLDPLRTSCLPDLITNSWLSDSHINAGCDFINNHPSCPYNLRVLHSFFLGVLRLRLQRRSKAPSRRTVALDGLISDGTINELLIPVHQPSHWALLYIDLVPRRYAYIDSLDPARNTLSWSCINPVNEWLSEVFNRDIVLSAGVRPFVLGAQSDSHSCGVAVLSSMAHYALGSNFPAWFQHSAKEHRLRWALALFNLDEKNVSRITAILLKYLVNPNPGYHWGATNV